MRSDLSVRPKREIPGCVAECRPPPGGPQSVYNVYADPSSRRDPAAIEDTRKGCCSSPVSISSCPAGSLGRRLSLGAHFLEVFSHGLYQNIAHLASSAVRPTTADGTSIDYTVADLAAPPLVDSFEITEILTASPNYTLRVACKVRVFLAPVPLQPLPAGFRWQDTALEQLGAWAETEEPRPDSTPCRSMSTGPP